MLSRKKISIGDEPSYLWKGQSSLLLFVLAHVTCDTTMLRDMVWVGLSKVQNFLEIGTALALIPFV